MSTRTRVILVCAALFAGGVMFGWLLAPRDSADVVDVTVREGAPQIDPGTDAVVTVRTELIENALLEALQQAELPFEMEDYSVEAVDTGIRIEGRAKLKVRGFDLQGRIGTTAHPIAEPDGTIGVRLSNTKVVGVRLPSVVEETLQTLVNDEIAKATNLQGYRVVRVETSAEQLFVYLAIDQEKIVSAR